MKIFYENTQRREGAMIWKNAIPKKADQEYNSFPIFSRASLFLCVFASY
jgi:hypothetical protein